MDLETVNKRGDILTYIIPIDPNERYQAITVELSPYGNARRFRIEVRYLNESDRWYISVFDASTGEAFFRYVPVIASYEHVDNLIGHVYHKNIGCIFCIPIVDNPSSINPGLNNLSEFAIGWSDGLD